MSVRAEVAVQKAIGDGKVDPDRDQVEDFAEDKLHKVVVVMPLEKPEILDIGRHNVPENMDQIFSSNLQSHDQLLTVSACRCYISGKTWPL